MPLFEKWALTNIQQQYIQIVKNQREEKLSELERKLHRACDQMEVLMTAESRAVSRQKGAKRSCHGSALYTRQLQVNVNVKN